MLRSSLLVLLSATLWLTGCSKDPQDRAPAFFRGTVSDHTYRNPYFGLVVPLPHDESWTMKEPPDLVMQSMGDGTSRLEARRPLERLESVMLLHLEHTRSSNRPIRPSLLVSSYAFHLPAAAKDPDALLVYFRNSLEIGQLAFETPEEVRTIELGGRPFRSLLVRLQVHQDPIYQRFLVSQGEEQGLVLVLSWTDGAEEQALQSILSGIHFE